MAIHIRQNASASVSSMQRMMKKAYKSELDPNNKQVTSMRRHVRAVRWAYNWGIGRIGRRVLHKSKGAGCENQV
jgi:hypothetical protein